MFIIVIRNKCADTFVQHTAAHWKGGAYVLTSRESAVVLAASGDLLLALKNPEGKV